MKKPVLPLQPRAVQFKPASVAQQAKHPIAPPVYRPQPVPKVLQPKTATNLRIQTAAPAPASMARVSHRPQIVPTALPAKAADIPQARGPHAPATKQISTQPKHIPTRPIVQAKGLGQQGVIQAKLIFEHQNGLITRCEFEKRPGWSTEVRQALPSQPGQDRGHIMPWLAIRLELERNLINKNQADAFLYLQAQGCTPASSSWADIEKAIKQLGRDENNDLANLEYENASKNRSNGAKLPEARRIWDAAHGTGGEKWKPPYKVNDVYGNPVTLWYKDQAKSWCVSVGVSENASKAQVKSAQKRFSKAPCVIS